MIIVNNNVYYLSLSRGLAGYYIKILATDEDVVRGYGSNYYANNWCSVYTQEDFDRVRNGINWKHVVINEDDPIELNDCPYYD